jgi:hypothetical protein
MFASLIKVGMFDSLINVGMFAIQIKVGMFASLINVGMFAIVPLTSALLNLPKGKSLGRSKPATNSKHKHCNTL